MSLPFEDIVEIKIYRTSEYSDGVEKRLNSLLAQGWILLDIMRTGNWEGGSTSNQIYTQYHFGKKSGTSQISLKS
jgi:hypothetical protein